MDNCQISHGTAVVAIASRNRRPALLRSVFLGGGMGVLLAWTVLGEQVWALDIQVKATNVTVWLPKGTEANASGKLALREVTGVVSENSQKMYLPKVAGVLDLPQTPARIELFDVVLEDEKTQYRGPVAIETKDAKVRSNRGEMKGDVVWLYGVEIHTAHGETHGGKARLVPTPSAPYWPYSMQISDQVESHWTAP